MRRALVIFLQFLPATRHEHPHMRLVLRSFIILCAGMKVPKDEFFQRIDSIFAQAGVSEADKNRIVSEVFFPKLE